MSETKEMQSFDYRARQQLVNRAVVPAMMVSGAIFSWLAGSGDVTHVTAFLFVFSFQATLAALWIGFGLIGAPAQLLVLVLLCIEGVFAARNNVDGLFTLLMQEPGWVLITSMALLLGCRLWSLWYTIDPGYMARAKLEARNVIQRNEDSQFTIWHLLLVPALFGVFIKIGPWIYAGWMGLFEWAQMLSVYFVVGSFPSLLAVWAMLSLSGVWWRILAATVLAGLLIRLLGDATIRNQDSVYPFFMAQYFALLAYLALCRWCGHRFVPWPNVVGITWNAELTERWHRPL